MSNQNSDIKSNITPEESKNMTDSLNEYRRAIKEWKKGMEKYENAQQQAKQSRGFAVMGFPSKPKLEDFIE